MTQRAPKSGRASPPGPAAGGGEGAGPDGAPRRPEVGVVVEADEGGVAGDAVAGAGSSSPRRRRSTKVKPDSGSDPTTDPSSPKKPPASFHQLSTDRSTEPETQQGAGPSRQPGVPFEAKPHAILPPPDTEDPGAVARSR